MEADYLTPKERRLDDLFSVWADDDDLSREQTAFVDIYWALGRIGNGGIHGFWETMAEHADRIIESFGIAGEDKLSELLDESRFILEAEVDDEGFYRLGEKETEIISTAEEMLFEDSFIDRVSEFVQRIISNDSDVA